MILRLEREVEITTWRVTGGYVVLEDRSDLLAVLVSIVEHGGEATSEELGGHLFGSGRTVMAGLVLSELERRSLVESSGSTWFLADAGIDALRQGSVPRIDWGTFDLDIVDDAVLGRRLVGAVRTANQQLGAWVREPSFGVLEAHPDGLPDLPDTSVSGSRPTVRPLTGLVEASRRMEWQLATLVVSHGADLTEVVLRRGTSVHGVASSVFDPTAVVLEAQRLVAERSGGEEGGLTPAALDESKIWELDGRFLTDEGHSEEIGEVVAEGSEPFIAWLDDLPVRPSNAEAGRALVARRVLQRLDGYATSTLWSELCEEEADRVTCADGAAPSHPDRQYAIGLAEMSGDRDPRLIRAALDWDL